jgi:hypothetical protein
VEAQGRWLGKATLGSCKVISKDKWRLSLESSDIFGKKDLRLYSSADDEFKAMHY